MNIKNKNNFITFKIYFMSLPMRLFSTIFNSRTTLQSTAYLNRLVQNIILIQNIIFNFKSHILICNLCMCVSLCMHAMQGCTCEAQRTTCHANSSSTVQVPEIGLRSPGLAASELNHLAGPWYVCFILPYIQSLIPH